MSAMLTIYVSEGGQIEAVASQGCRWLTRRPDGFDVDVGGYRVRLNTLESVEGYDRLIPFVVSPGPDQGGSDIR